MTEINNYGLGWVFFDNQGVSGGNFLPFETDDLVEWIKGFMAAQADYDYPQQYHSIEAALIGNGVSGKLLDKLLTAAEKIINSNNYLVVPNVPVRGQPKSTANLRVVK